MRLQLRTVQVYMRLFHVRTATWPVRPPKASLSVEMSRGSCCRLWWLVLASPPIQWWLTRCPVDPMRRQEATSTLRMREAPNLREGCKMPNRSVSHGMKRSGERLDLSWVSESVARATCRMHNRQAEPRARTRTHGCAKLYGYLRPR